MTIWRRNPLASQEAEERVLRALRDIDRNDGVMWEPDNAVEAVALSEELRRRGWVRGSSITDAGRKALEQSQ